MEENKRVVVKGNETVQELVTKVNEVDSTDDKMGVCIMIISLLEIKNGLRHGSYTHNIGMSKDSPPRSPEEHNRLFQQLTKGVMNKDPYSDINTFLFFLKKTDENCYMELVNMYEKKSKKEELKERVVVPLYIVGTVIILIILLNLL